MGNIDCCWKIGTTSKWTKQHEELRYSIRSVVKHFSNLRNIVIVGTKPSWTSDKIIHIPAEDKFKHNKDASIINKLLIACDDNRISDNFLNCSDDQLLIRPITTEQFKPWTINSDVRRIDKNRKNVTTYGKRVILTLATLKSKNLPYNLYEGHIFYLLNKEKYKEILSKYNFEAGKGLCGNTIYFNNILKQGGEPVEQVRAFLKRPISLSAIKKEVVGKLFLGYQRKALNIHLKDYLKQTFKEKTIYEK